MPRNASLDAAGFRFYEWNEPGKEPVRVLSVTSIRKLVGVSYYLVEWQLGNVVRLAMGTRRITRVGPRGGLREVYVQDGEFPGEFARRLLDAKGDEQKMAEVKRWLRHAAEEPRDVAAVRGSVVHKMIENNVALDRVDEALVRQYLDDQWAHEVRKTKVPVVEDDISFIGNGMAQYWDMREHVPFVILAQEPQVWNLCHTVGTRVLTRDLRWVPAEELRVGDKLWALSEGLAWRPGARYRWEPGEVTATRLSQAETVRVTMTSGRVLHCTLDHPLLAQRRAVAAPTTRTPVEWVEAQHLRPGDVLPRYLDPWDADQSPDAAWLAGVMDGEGWVSRNRVSIAQKEGLVAQRMREVMGRLGLTWSEQRRPGAIAFVINGSTGANARLLGSLRPVRLLPKFNPEGQQLDARQAGHDVVVSVEPAGIQTIVNLTTSTKTYFAEGYGSHNTAGYAGSADVFIWFLGHWVEEQGPEQLDDNGQEFMPDPVRVFHPLPGVGPAEVRHWQHEAARGRVTVETIAKIGGEVCLGDWKTSKGVYTDHVVQMHAYLGAEFVGSDGKRDKRLTDLLEPMMRAALVHIRPDGWHVDFCDFSQPTLYAFIGSVVFARFLATYPKPDGLFTHSVSGKAPGTEASDDDDDD